MASAERTNSAWADAPRGGRRRRRYRTTLPSPIDTTRDGDREALEPRGHAAIGDSALQSSPHRELLTEPPRLPARLTSFVGRKQEVADVCRLLLTKRLLTLTGPGGIGKSRLAWQIASNVADRFADGVFAVELAPIAAPEMVVPAIARCLGLREQPGESLTATLARFLRNKSLLLVLDNFEHLLPAGLFIADLLATCPELKVLATSRSSLHIEGEQEVPVPPMGMPVPPWPSYAQLTQFDALRLFVERAQAVKPGFRLTGETAVTVAELCAGLDGLPLAIELAAARTRVLSPGQMLARLGHRLPLLVGGARNLPARLQTLRDSIAWSYDLLGPMEQRLFRGLSVFAGGCSLESAEAVCGITSDLEGTVFEGLTSLVDSNLLQSQDSPENDPRFVMLETIREFARERLKDTAPGEEEFFSLRHVAYFQMLAESGEAALRLGPGQLEWLARLEREHANLRAAVHMSAEYHASEQELRLTGSLAYFWIMRGYFDECLARLNDALARGQAASPAGRAKALIFVAYLSMMRRDPDTARRMLDQALPLAEESGDVSSLVLLAITRGHLARAAGHIAEALQFIDGALARVERAGLTPPCIVRWQQASMLMWAGDLGRASQLLQQILPDAEACGDKYTAIAVVADLGTISFLQADIDGATELFRRTLRLAQEVGELFMAEHCLETLAAAAMAQGRPRRVPLLLGAADRLCARLGIPSSDEVVPSQGLRRPLPAGLSIASAVAGARAELGNAAFDTARRTGQTLSVEELLSDGVDTAQADYTSATRPPGHPLTARELEVVAHLARGRTNPEIASALVIARSTAERHVANILNKLSLHSRTEVAMWAVENHLVEHQATTPSG